MRLTPSGLDQPRATESEAMEIVEFVPLIPSSSVCGEGRVGTLIRLAADFAGRMLSFQLIEFFTSRRALQAAPLWVPPSD